MAVQESVSEFRVRYAETDQMGVVYHANYLIWCEIGRTDFIRQCGMTYAQMERDGVKLAVTECQLRMHASARYDELIRVTTTLATVRSRSVQFAYTIANADTGERIVSAVTTLISVNADGRTVSIPAEIRALLERGPLVV